MRQNEWWFSIVDIVEALAGNDKPRKYLNDLKKKLILEGYIEVSEKIGQLKFQRINGERQEKNWIITTRFHGEPL